MLVNLQLTPTSAQQFCRRNAFVSEQTVSCMRRFIAWMAVVENEHAPQAAAQNERRT
jgi:hypothetical protein